MQILPILACLAALVKPGPIIVKPDIQDGEIVTKLRVIKVRVQSDSIVTQVEFYVGDDLRDSATSTPYTFKLDPLNEKDGDLKLTFTAYTTEGDKASKSVDVKIDSGVSKGAEANTQAAEDALVDSKWDDAISAARVALRADPSYNPARMVMARAYMKKGVYDKAQQFAEDVVHSDPQNLAAKQLLAAIALLNAFNGHAGSVEAGSLEKHMTEALNMSMDNQRAISDQAFDKLGNPTPDTLVHYADVAMACQHYSPAIEAMTTQFNRTADAKLGDRIAYAQLRLSRFDDMRKTLDLMQRAKTSDAYGHALLAALSEYRGDEHTAQDEMQNALSLDPQSVGVLTCEAYIALRTNSLPQLQRIISALENQSGQLPEVNYYLSVLYGRVRRYDDSNRAFLDAVLVNPLDYRFYLARGNQSLLKLVAGSLKGKEENSIEGQIMASMYAAALKAKPDSVEALTAYALMDCYQKKLKEGLDWAGAAVKAAPDYPASHYIDGYLSSLISSDYREQAISLRNQVSGDMTPDVRAKVDAATQASDAYARRSMQELDLAGKCDPIRLGGKGNLSLPQAFYYFETFGQLPIIAAPTGG